MMGVKLISPHKSRERILCYGSFSSGKTYNWMSVAKATTGTFWVLDTDQTVLPYLESDEFAELEDRLEHRQPYEWGEYVEAMKEFRQKAKPDDWIVVDMMNAPWAEVQNHFAERVYGKELGDHWMSYMETLKQADAKGSKSPFDGTTDWQAIKRMYAMFTAPLVRATSHLYLAAPEKKIGPFDGVETNTQFGEVGVKPDCEKSTPHMTRTVIRMMRYRATTVKDRQRETLQGTKIGDFAEDYLKTVAGWKVDVAALRKKAS